LFPYGFIINPNLFFIDSGDGKMHQNFPALFSPFTGNSEKFSFKWFSILPVIPAVYRP
jgi:hypothetical protein